MLKKSDLIYLTIVFFLMRHFKLFNKINTFKKKKDISYSVGIKFIALLIITYVFKTVVIYLLKKLNLIKFLPNMLKNDIIEGHEPGCVIVYGEPGEPLNTWQVATINETENVNLNHCYFNVETNSWDRNPNNLTTTDTTNCMCQSGTHRHQENDPLGPGTAERPIIDIGLSQTVTTPLGIITQQEQVTPPSEDPGTVTPATCVPPANISSFNIQDPPSDADLTIDNFNVTLQCADGFTGTATATACSADGEEYTITSDCVEGEAGMVLTEPFLVFMSDSEIDAGTPGSGVYCADICSNRGLTCTNSVGPQNSFQSNNAVGSTGYNNDFRDYLLSVPEEYRNNRLHNALQNPNMALNYQAFRTNFQQVEILEGNNTVNFGEFLNERDDMTCHPTMGYPLRSSTHFNNNRWAHAFCSCQQP